MNYTYKRRLFWMRRICQLATIGFLAAGFTNQGFWLGAGLVLIGLVVLWWLGERYSKPWLSSAVLFASTGIAAGGLWVGVSPVFMLPGVIAALAWSELIGTPPGSIHALDPQVCTLVQQNRIRMVVGMTVVSLLITCVGMFWKWHLDFGFVFLIGVSIGLALYGLYRTIHHLQQ